MNLKRVRCSLNGKKTGGKLEENIASTGPEQRICKEFTWTRVSSYLNRNVTTTIDKNQQYSGEHDSCCKETKNMYVPELGPKVIVLEVIVITNNFSSNCNCNRLL